MDGDAMTGINLGIIGLGRIGKCHAQNILQGATGFRLFGVADPQLDKSWLESFDIPLVTDDPHAILSHQEIAAILIATPVDTHVSFIRQAAKYHKHVFCEKPLAQTASDIQDIISCVKQSNIHCQLGFNRRFDPNFAELKRTIQSGKLGKPYLIRITSRDPELAPISYLKESGGMFLDMSIHDFDMARFIMGEEVTALHAMGAACVSPEVAEIGDIDTAVVNMTFQSGALGVIENCRQADFGYDQRIEVLCEKGKVQVHNTSPTSVVFRHSEGQVADKPHYFFLDKYATSYIEELKAFYHAITSNGNVPVTAEDALPAFHMAQAAQKSLQSQQTQSLINC